MARLLLFIFITIHPGDRAFSQEPEGLGGGRMGEDGHRCPRGAEWVGLKAGGPSVKLKPSGLLQFAVPSVSAAGRVIPQLPYQNSFLPSES